jgi:hypothetical protein
LVLLGGIWGSMNSGETYLGMVVGSRIPSALRLAAAVAPKRANRGSAIAAPVVPTNVDIATN